MAQETPLPQMVWRDDGRGVNQAAIGVFPLQRAITGAKGVDAAFLSCRVDGAVGNRGRGVYRAVYSMLPA